MNINDAKKAGAQAFLNGKHRAPALNQKFLRLACSSETQTPKLLEAYCYGWDIACLSDNAALPTMPSIKIFNEIFEY